MHHGCPPSWIVAGLTMAVCTTALASDPSPQADLDHLRKMILQAADQPPQPQAAQDAARARVSASLQQLDLFLKGAAEPTKSQWTEYLRLPALQAELNRTEPDAAALGVLADRLYQNQPGLELPAMVSLRRALRDYLAARQYAAADTPPAFSDTAPDC